MNLPLATAERNAAQDADIDAEILLSAVARMIESGGATDWAVMVEMGLPRLCRDDGGRLTDVIDVLAALGRAASPLPLPERIVLNRFAPDLVPPDARVAIAFGEVGGDGQAGGFDVQAGAVSGNLRLVDGAALAKVLVAVDAAGTLYALDPQGPGVRITATPALTAGLCDVKFDHAPVVAQHHIGADAEALLATLRLCLSARALGATQQGFDAVTAYARIRRQFGQAIGSFQAIQHKLANGHIALTASRLMLRAAAQAFDDNDDAQSRPLADAAIAFTGPALRDVALQTQHAFGAIGFAEEHEAPALFRRVHTDVVRLGGARAAHDRLGDHMLAGAAHLSGLLADGNDPAAPFRDRLREWLAANWTAEDRAMLEARSFAERDWDPAFIERLGQGGWTTLNWPHAAGGMGASPFEQLAFTEELQRAGAPEHAVICGCRILAPEIIAHGTDTLRDDMLPRLRDGTITGCLGYSEPEAGSDLASLRTAAIRDGDDYVINGQKIWTTDGQRASHMILAARTDPDPATRHRGISLFILPMSTPGITVRAMTGLHGHVFCNIFFDDVRLPAHHRLGEEGQGWAILSNALANERITMGGFVSRLAVLLDRVIAQVRDDARLQSDAVVRARIGELAARLLAGRMLAVDSIRQMAAGHAPLVEAAMGKTFASELAQEICEAALDLLGGRALLSFDAPDAPAGGMIEEILRLSIMYVVGGGSNEIQRSLIAGRGLSLGR